MTRRVSEDDGRMSVFRLSFGLFALLLVISGVSGALTDDIVLYYTFDNSDTSGTTTIDSVGTENGTITSATTGKTGILNEAYGFASTGSSITTDDAGSLAPATWSVGGWIKPDSYTGDSTSAAFLVEKIGSVIGRYTYRLFTCDGVCSSVVRNDEFACGMNIGGTSFNIFSGTSYNTTSFHHVICTYDGSDLTLYVNGVNEASTPVSGTPEASATRDFVVGVYSQGSGYNFNGTIDELGLWSRALNSTEISALYNDGSGFAYPFGGDPPTPGNYSSLTLIDAYDGSSINTFNATINGSSYSTTNGTIVLPILTNTTSLYTITFAAEDYFTNTSYNVNLSSGSYEGSTAQAWVSYRCVEGITGLLLPCDEVGPYARQAGTYTDTVNVSGYFSQPVTYTLSALDNTPSFTWDLDDWNNPAYVFDGDYSTYGNAIRSGPFESGQAYAYWNYTQYEGTSVTFRIGLDTTRTYTIPADCRGESFNFDGLQLRARSNVPDVGLISSRLDCRKVNTSTSWLLVWDDAGNDNFYEHNITGTRLPAEATFYSFNLTISADDYAGNPESDFIVNVFNSELGINYTNTTNGTSITYDLLAGYEYNVTVNATSTIYGDPVNQIGTATITNTTAAPQSLEYQFNLTAARTINFNFYYEENLTAFDRNASISLTPLTDDSNLFFYFNTTNGTLTAYNIPINEYRLTVESDGYHDENRYFVLGTYTGQNLTAYFRENTTGSDRTFYAVDQRNVLQNGWFLRFQRFYNGTGWITVDESRTNIDGVAVQNLLPSEYYRVILLDEDFEEQYRSERTFLFEDEYQVSPSQTVVSSTQIEKTLGVSGRVEFSESTVTAYGTSTSGTREWKLDLYRYYTDGPVLVNSTTASGDSPTLSLSMPNSTGRYEAVLSIIGSEIPVAANGISTLAGVASLGVSGALYTLVVLLATVSIGVFSAPAAIILAVLALMVANLIGILSIANSALIGVVIIAALIVYRRAQ